MDSAERILPIMELPVPIVCELPTCQKTLQEALPNNTALEPGDMTRVVPMRNYHASVEEHVPQSVKVVVSCVEEANF
jgi:hypothetical protein